MSEAPIHYAEHRPCAELAPYVRCYWVLRTSPALAGERQLIVPDGSMELVLSMGDALVEPGASAVTRPEVTLVGEVRRPVEVMATGASDLLGVRFFPDAARSFVEPEPHELVDGMGDERALTPRLRAAMTRVMAAPPASRIHVLEQALLEAIRTRRMADRLVRTALHHVLAAGGQVEVAELETRLGVSRRQLERRFRDAVGVPPKALAQVVRFRRVLRAIEVNSPRWSEVAANAGYYDQSHLIRDFKRFTGRTPGAYLDGHHPLTALLDGSDAVAGPR